MTIESIAASALIKEGIGAAAAKAGEELALKMGQQMTENLRPTNSQRELQAIEQLTQMNQFRIGENNSPELNNRNVLKQREINAGNELKEKFESDTTDIKDQADFLDNQEIIDIDDNGQKYKDADGALLPNIEYEINGIKYKTDENGRKISWEGDLKDTPENVRDNNAQMEAGGNDRQKDDHGGHLVARMNGGAEGNENMVAMRGHINQSDYKRGENEENQMLKNGENVHESGNLTYNGDSSRPSKLEKTYTNGDKTVEAVYDNEIGSTDLIDRLDGIISDDDLSSLKDEIADMQTDNNEVSVTSISKEYDSDGKLTKTNVGVRNETTGEKEFKSYEHLQEV